MILNSVFPFSFINFMSNRLTTEHSPYLLQHAENPVDWHPWGSEAFTKAHEEDKPIFLSIGYSTCHWCHVMEHESFMSQEVANVLNRDFVSIKVDREERPDLDRVYMSFVQATTGAGGWPMSVWLTPDLKPFFGGTYFPPSLRWGRPGFIEILHQISHVWITDRAQAMRSAEDIVRRLRESSGGNIDSKESTHDAGAKLDVSGRRPVLSNGLREGVAYWVGEYDSLYGGFGNAPKFPRPTELLFLLREYARMGDENILTMATGTLRAMALGGIHDQIGGGFHRYSVDAEWRVPHFEKMLYDQAQLTLAYLEAFQVTGEEFYLTVADSTLDYVLREMTDSEGGFYSAEDADSIPPELVGSPSSNKQEGAFYVWTFEEVDTLLTEVSDLVSLRFDIRPEGNAPHDPQGEFRYKNLLYVARSVEEISTQTEHSLEKVDAALMDARKKLFDARSRRPRPHLDDKILTSWNGLMIAALARAARVFEREENHFTKQNICLTAARRAAAFIQQRMWNEETGGLYRRYRCGEVGIDGYCEDYASLIWGLIELFQVDSDPNWLEWALRLQHRQDELFWDAAEGGWFSTSGEDPTVLLRLKEEYDGAEPSANSVSAMNILMLWYFTEERDFMEKFECLLLKNEESLGKMARVVPHFMSVVSTCQAKFRQVVLIGRAGDGDTEAMKCLLAGAYDPFSLVMYLEPGNHQEHISKLVPWVKKMTMRNGHATAYVCHDFVCQEPVNDVSELKKIISER
jgi:uncharacterized protein YyaL (SSP411 family)